jgi:hypothetical protein
VANQQTTLQKFFAGKSFIVPQYQRGYAWKHQNIMDLFNDIKEAIEIGSGHYIGTVVLIETADKNVYGIVDGQQRITTLIMLIDAIIKNITNQDDKIFYRRTYIEKSGSFVLTPLPRDQEFFFSIMRGVNTVDAENKSQRLMKYASEKLNDLVKESIHEPLQILEAIESLSILEFIEKKESDAIRIFETVNDRGVRLSEMDKVKSKLFYFSNKYLEGELDQSINVSFGSIFVSYDSIKEISKQQKIGIVSSKEFTEDNFLKHHHICFSADSNDPSSDVIMRDIDSTLKEFRDENNFDGMKYYISDYIESLKQYVLSFEQIMIKTQEDSDYYKLFRILGLTVAFYPIITQLESKGILDEILPNRNITVLDMITIIEIRLFKVRRYAGTKYIAEFARDLNKAWSIEKIEKELERFCILENSQSYFIEQLNGDMYGQTALLRTLFITYCEELRGRRYSIRELSSIMRQDPTIEHILPQEPAFGLTAYGFNVGIGEYEEYKNKLGNLTILKRSDNSAIGNNHIVDKLEVYAKSGFKITEVLAAKIETELNNTFKKKQIKERTEELVQLFAERWK